MEKNEDALVAIVSEIKKLTDTFERVATALKKQADASGSRLPRRNRAYQDKELLPAKER